jgi:hypothetical protein
MAMQYDVRASIPLTASGQVKNQSGNNLDRVRIKTIYGISNTSIGSVVLHDGEDDSAPILITIDTPAKADDGTFWLPLPGEGILAKNGVYADITNVTSVMIIYG